MDSVAQFIQSELLARRAVSLPYIGTLALVRHSAQLSPEGGYMNPPYDALELDPAFFDQSRALPELLSSVEAYNRWYYSSLDASGVMLYVHNVCAIDLQSFAITMAEPFAELLAPVAQAEQPVAIGRTQAEIAHSGEVQRAVHRTVRRKQSSSWALTLSLLVVIGALAYILYTSFFEV